MAGRTTNAARPKARTAARRSGTSAAKPAARKPATTAPRASKKAIAKTAPKPKPTPPAKRKAARKPNGTAAGARARAIKSPSPRELLALRDAELALVSAIQRGVVTKLGFQEIVDIVGDKLRELFRTPDLGISWFDEQANLVHMLYVYEHGRRLSVAPIVPKPGGLYDTMRKSHLPVVIASTTADTRMGAAAPGTDMCKSMM